MKKTQSRDDTTNPFSHNSDDYSTPIQQHRHQDQFSPQTQIHRIASRFLRHFDYTFLLDRSSGGGTDTVGSGLSLPAEAYLRHYYSQQRQEQPVLRRRTTVDGSTSGRRTGFPPLVDRVDLGAGDVERLARSFVVVENDYDDGLEGGKREGVDEYGQQQLLHPQVLGPRFLNRKFSDPPIHLYGHHTEREKDDTNHAERMDSASTAATPTQTSRWSGFSLLPIISHRHTTTTTTTAGAEDGSSQDTTFVTSTTATLRATAVTMSATSFTATATATLVDCDSAEVEDEGLQQHRPSQEQQQQQQQERYDHVAISVDSTSTLSTGDRNENITGNISAVRGKVNKRAKGGDDNVMRQCALVLFLFLFLHPLKSCFFYRSNRLRRIMQVRRGY